jgi:hypothetical protein
MKPEISQRPCRCVSAGGLALQLHGVLGSGLSGHLVWPVEEDLTAAQQKAASVPCKGESDPGR